MPIITFIVVIALGLAVTVVSIGVALLATPIGLIVCLKSKTCQRKANQGK